MQTRTRPSPTRRPRTTGGRAHAPAVTPSAPRSPESRATPADHHADAGPREFAPPPQDRAG